MPQAFELYIFHRANIKEPIYQRVFHRTAPEDQRNTAAFVAILDTFASTLDTFGQTADASDVRAITTEHYKMHHLKTATGLRFILLTDPTVVTDAGHALLQALYRRAYVELVAKDPGHDAKIAAPIVNEAFGEEVNAILRSVKLVS